MAYNPNLYSMYQQPINGLISVSGIEGAKAYQLPANSAMPLFDADQDLMYVKTTDGAGFPTIKTFKFEAVEQQATQTDSISRAEFDALAAQVKELINGKQSIPEEQPRQQPTERGQHAEERGQS